MRHPYFDQKSRYSVLWYSVTIALSLFYFQSGITQVSIVGVDIPYLQDFNTLASGGGSGSTMPASWVFLEMGAGSNGTYAVDAGATSTENTYSYGNGSTIDRSLGQINTATFSTKAGASFINNTGVTISSLLIQYFGEQWRLGTIGRTDRIDFQYSTNATAIDNGTWTDFDGLDFTGPIQSGSVGALDGNAAANRTLLAKTISGLSLADGASIWIRWNSWEANGNDDGLSIDDFALTANPSLHYTVSNNGVSLSITDTDGNGEGLYVSQQGANIRFYAPGRTYSLNAGATTALPIDVAIAGLSFIVINAGTGNDTIHVAAFTTNLPGFTINGGIDHDVVNMNGDINFVSGAAFNADLQNDAATPGTDQFNVATNANLICSGTGIATIKVSHTMVLNSGASIVTANGNLVVEANQQFTPTTGNFAGLRLTNALLQVTGTGSSTIKGKGGTASTNNHGIYLLSGSNILGGASGALTITASGGTSSENANHGLSVIGASSISSVGAPVNITGTGGGSNASFANYGVHVINNSTISAGVTGVVTISGTGGNATGGNNMGVWVGTSGTINSNGGNVNVTGVGGGASGTGTHNYGIHVQGGGKITCGGSGTVNVNGTGGMATGNANDGVSIWDVNSLITSSGGPVNVTGQGGGITASGSNFGVHLQASGMISAGSTGAVTVSGTGGATSGINNSGIFVIENGSAITSGGGNVTLNGFGGGTGSSTGNYGIIVFQGLVSAGGFGSVTMTGTGGLSSGANNVGIRVSEVNGTVTSGGGDIQMTGIEGSGPDGYAISVYSSGTVTTAVNGGNITLIGNSIHIAAAISTNTTSGIAIQQYTNAVDMNLGPATNSIGGPLNLSDTELDFITTGTMFLGNEATTGTITITSSITRTAITHIGISSYEDVIINGGSLNANGGNVVFDAGDTPAAIQALEAGVDVTCGSTYPVGNLLIDITGTVADVSYTQFSVIGEVNLVLASLTLTGTYDPQPGDMFIILSNDGVDAISGTFSGLSEGETITSFLGSPFPATISYIGGTGNDVVITVASPHYLLSTTGNQIVFTDIAGNGETITMNQSGLNSVQFVVPGRNYSMNGGAITALPVVADLEAMDMVTINAGIGDDGIVVNAFTASMCHLTLNGGIDNDIVTMNGDIVFGTNANLNIDLQNDDPNPGTDNINLSANANLPLLGLGIATLKCSRNITFNAGSSLTAENGNITLEANQQVTPSTGTFSGVFLASNSLVEVTGVGTLDVKGKGGTVNNAQIGVYVYNSAILRGGTSGNHYVTGIGGATTSNDNRGIQVQLNAIITTNGGDLIINAQGGGTGASAHNHGIHVVQSGVISAGGLGNLTITTFGGLSTGIRNHGIHVYNAGSIITSGGGNVYLFGQSGGSGTSSYNHGVFVEDFATITAGGLGTVTVDGYGGTAMGDRNDGVICYRTGATITSGGGDVVVNGLGGGTGSSSYNYGVMLDNGGIITAGGIGQLHVNGTGGATAGLRNIGVIVFLQNSFITSSGGNVTVTGAGGGTTGTSLIGVNVKDGATITAGGNGQVNVTGNGGWSTEGYNYGIHVQGSNATITSSGGNVFVNGQGGGTANSPQNVGVLLEASGKIKVAGTSDIHVTGTAGQGANSGHFGVFVSGAQSLIETQNGDVHVIGIGGGVESSGGSYGVYIYSGSRIQSVGNGDVHVQGSGGVGVGADFNHGVLLSSENASIYSSAGNVSVIGLGGGGGTTSDYNYGVYLFDNSNIFCGQGGSVEILGTGGQGVGLGNVGVGMTTGVNHITGGGPVMINGIEGEGSTSYGILLDGDATLTTDSLGGNITLVANSILSSGTIETPDSNMVTIRPDTTGISIHVSGENEIVGGPLMLSDTELDLIHTGLLKIGSLPTDSIKVISDITRIDTLDITLLAGGDIVLDTGTVSMSGGNLIIECGPSPFAFRPTSSGTDVAMDTISINGDLAIVINGLLPDVQHHQLKVTGHVDLHDTELILSGSYDPFGTDSFVIIHNDLNDMIIGTFNGLAEGDTIFDVLGDTLDATITYAGGDGNDVVIRMIQLCLIPSDVMISTTADTACAGTVITLELASGNLGDATEWHWYSNGCGTTSEGTGTSIMVTPSDTTTYYVRGEGGCVINEDCVSKTIVIHPFPDATIYQEFPDSCYYIDRLFRPDSPEIPGATYLWDFGPTAIPTSAIGYGPHIVYYTVPGLKNVELVIHPNADGAQCSDSSTVAFTIYNCPGQIVGDVKSDIGNPIASVNVRLFADADTNGIADNSTAIRSVFTTSLGVYAMAALTPGHYVLVQTQPVGWISLDDMDTSDDGDVVSNSDSLDNIIPVTIIPREEDEDNKFIERPAPGTVTGVVFQDFDLDQFPDPGEGLNSITVHLFPDANTNGIADTIVPIASVVTAGNGDYTFPNIPVGHYVLVEIQDTGFISIKDFDASNDSDIVPNANMTNDTLPVTVINGETDAHNYFIDAQGCGLEVTNTLDDGPGSLRYTLGCAGIGDTIHFHPTLSGLTIEITSDQLMLTTDVVVESMLNPQVILSSQIEGMFHIEAGVAVELRGVTVISGLSAGGTGAAFENHGMLTLHNTTILRNPLFTSGEYLIRNHPGAELTFSGECFIEKD